jgi:hypothetical protein
MKARSRWFTWLMVAGAWLAPARVLADPTAQDRASARAMFDEGRALAHAGNFVAACPKFQESQRIDPGIGTLFNLADCQEHTGRTASAWSNFLEVADAARQAKQAYREQIARARAESLVPRLAHLVFAVAEKADSVSIQLDSTVLGGGAIGAALPVDPGEHAVEVSAAGKQKWKTSVTIAQGATLTLNVPELESVAVLAPPIVAPPVTPAALSLSPAIPTRARPADVIDVRSESVRPWQRPVALGFGGLGVVGLAAGTFFGLRAQSQWSMAEPKCPSTGCTAEGHGSWSDSRHNAAASTIAFAAGAGLLATGIVLWLTVPKSARPLQVGIAPNQVTCQLKL